MYGGSALALQLGHRYSIDFDLFIFRDISQSELTDTIPFLAGATTLQQHNRLSVLVDRDGPVSVSFFGVPKLFALADPIRFMAYAMARATHEDMRALRAYVSDADFREALEHALPGIIDPRSWAYWNSKAGRWPPQRFYNVWLVTHLQPCVEISRFPFRFDHSSLVQTSSRTSPTRYGRSPHILPDDATDNTTPHA